MSTIEDTVFTSGELRISVTSSPDAGTVIAWLGTSDARDPGAELTPFLSGLAERLAGGQVSVDFRKLEYMNSATVSPIIHFARALDSHGVKTRLYYDSSVGWQRVNFVAMKSIAKTLKLVEVEG